MTAIVADKSNCQLIPISQAYNLALKRLYADDIADELHKDEWSVFLGEKPEAAFSTKETHFSRQWEARQDIENLITVACLSGSLVARAYNIDDSGTEKRCLLPIQFWDTSPNSSFSMSAFCAFNHGIVEDSTRIKTITGFGKIWGWLVGVGEQEFLAWLDSIAATKLANKLDITPSKPLPVKRLHEWNIN